MTKEKNFVMTFISNSMAPDMYVFLEVAMIEDGVIISDTENNGKRLRSALKVDVSFKELDRIIMSPNTEYISARGFYSGDYKQFNYVFFVLSGADYSEYFHRFLSEGVQVSDINKKIVNYLYTIGDKIATVQREYSSMFKIKTKNIDIANIPSRSDETLDGSIRILKKEMAQNESSNPAFKPSKTPKANNKVGTVDVSSIEPDEVIARIKERVISQDLAIRDVVNTLFLNQMLIDMADETALMTGKANILIDGPTGTGKTMLIKELSSCLSLPMTIASATSFSTTGYKGADLENVLVKLLDAANGDIKLAERGIIAFDEFDKLGAKDDKEELALRKALQEELLTYLSGGKFDINYNGKTIEFDTSKITFIALGAFTRLRERKIAENESSYNPNSTLNDGEYSKTYVIDIQDYIDEGLHREIVGRFTAITNTNALTVEDYKKIMLESLASPLRTLEKLVSCYNKTLIYGDEVLTYIAEITYKKNTGARGLSTIFNHINRALIDKIRSKNIKTIELTTELVENIQKSSVRSY